MTILPSPQQLRYLVALADQGHFGRAATSCRVSQSTLSAGIIALERQLDAALLERTGSKRPVFTSLGLEVLERARAALAALASVSETVEAARDPLAGPLRFGVIPTIGPFLLPRLMPALREAFPRLKLWLREDMTEHLVHGLGGGRLDLLLLALPCDCGDAETAPVAEDPFLVALPENHRLTELNRVPIGVVQREKLLLLEDGHCLRDQALAACDMAGASGDGFAATSLHTLVQMVAGGLGITLLPKLAVDGGVLNGAPVAIRPIDGVARRMLGLAWRARSPRAEEFRGLVPAIAAAVRAQGRQDRAA